MSPAVPKPKKRPKKVRKPIRRSRVRQKAGKPKRFAKRRDPEYLAWIRKQPCVIGERTSFSFCAGQTEASHLKSRGAGGDDRNNVLPLCHLGHQEQHRRGMQWWIEEYFEGKPEIAQQLAQQYTERYDRERSVG